MRSSRIRPVSWSTSYLFREPFGISIVTSNSKALLLHDQRILRVIKCLPRRCVVAKGAGRRVPHGKTWQVVAVSAATGLAVAAGAVAAAGPWESGQRTAERAARRRP